MYTKKFWKATAERVVSSIAGAALALVLVAPDAFTADWTNIASVSLMAGLASLLKGIAAGATGNGPGVGTAETLS